MPIATEISEGSGMKARVLYFLTSKVWGGIEEHVLSLITGLDKDLIEPHLVCHPALVNTMRKNPKAEGCKTFPLYLESWLQWREVRRLMGYIKELKPHIAHAHDFRASFLLMPLAKYMGVPITIETSHITGINRKGPIRGSYFFDRTLSRLTTKYIAVSHAIKKYFVEVKGIREDKIVVIHNGRDLSTFRPYEPSKIGELRRSMGLVNGRPVVTVVGRLHEQKGHCYLLESLPAVFQKHPQLQVFLVGDGPLRDPLERQASDLGIIGNVAFTGYKSNIQDWIAISDLIVLPSLWEGLPLVLIEASAMGKPVIATAVDGSPEVIVHGKTGLIVPPKDSAELGKAVDALLSDKHLREEMGKQGRQFVLENFRIETQIEKTQDLYEDLLRQNGFNYLQGSKVAQPC
jgi:glycosyltransferase involved in cell wall biosynthesis